MYSVLNAGVRPGTVVVAIASSPSLFAFYFPFTIWNRQVLVSISTPHGEVSYIVSMAKTGLLENVSRALGTHTSLPRRHRTWHSN